MEHAFCCAWHTEGHVVNAFYWYFSWFVNLWHVAVWVTVSAINHWTGYFVKWCAIFPNDFLFWGHFKETAEATFGDESVAVRKALCCRDELTVEGGVIYNAHHTVDHVAAYKAPFYLEGHRINFEHAGVVADVDLGAVYAHAVWHTIACPTTVVEEKDITFARKTLWNHVAMVLADDLTNAAKFLRFGKVWTNLPNNLTSFLGDDSHNVSFTSVPNDVVWMEAFIACIVPFVRTQDAHGVDVHPVTHFASLGEMLVRVTEKHVLGSLREAELVKVFAYGPLPNNIAFPVYFNDGVV